MYGLGLMGLFALGWAAVETIGGALADPLTAYQVVWSRYAVHLLLMVIVFGRRYGVGLVRTRRFPLQVGRSLLMLGMPLCWVAALAAMPTSTVAAVFWVAPLLALGFAAMLLRERVRPNVWLGTGLGVAGVLVMVHPSNPTVVGAVWALGAGICFGLYVVATRALRTEPTAVNLFYTALFVFLPLSALMPFVWHAMGLQSVAVLVAIGGVGLGALWALDRACEAAPVAAIIPVVLLEPVSQVGIAALRQRYVPEVPILLGALGILVIVAHTFLHQAREDRNQLVVKYPVPDLDRR